MRLPTALVVQHTPQESPARLGDWLGDAGVLLDVRSPYDGSQLPGLDGFAALVVLGGPMGAYDDGAAPWLPATRGLLRDAVRTAVPVLGVCLGAQLLAAALGGQVGRGAQGPEIGPGLVAKRDVAAEDRLFRPVPFTPDVMHWHWDEISSLPAAATLLASSTRYPNQAFRVGDLAWGLQFHVETTPAMVRQWAAEDADALAGVGYDVEAALRRWDLDAVHADLAEVWAPFARRFAEVVREREYATR
ncbi:MAG TPA: type 1 glutamine amidotransferase [Mycobacteriales bacterium]|nr:type 1 glutamine amidotransferase [Mycobacteriales bacterium]